MARPRLFTPTFGVLTLSAFAYFASYAILIPTLPRYVEGPLRGGGVAVGIVGGSFAVSALLLRPWVGSVGDRRGRRTLLIGGASVVIVSTFAMTAVSTLVPLVALRLLAGAGEAMFFVGAVSAITDISPIERRGEALSLFSVALYSAIALAPVLGETVLTRGGFDRVWIASGILAVVALILAVAAPETRAAGAAPTSGRLLHPAGLRPGLVLFCSVYGFAAWMSFMPLYVDDVGLGGSAGVLGAYGAMLVGIRLFGARIPDVFGLERVARAALVLSATGLATMGLWRAAAGLIAGTIVFGAGQALAFPALMALAATNGPPEERGAAVGTATAFIDLAFAVGPITAGVIVAAVDAPGAFLAAAAVAVGGSVALAFSRGQTRAPA